MQSCGRCQWLGSALWAGLEWRGGNGWGLRCWGKGDKATGFSDWGWVATRGLSVELMGPCARPAGRGRTWPRIGHRWPWKAATYMSISTAM